MLEREFKKVFTDYAKQEKADQELRELKMKDKNVNSYIVQFQQLAHRGRHNFDKPEILQRLTMGLPEALMSNCNLISNPQTFDDWGLAAQRHHHAYLINKSMKTKATRATRGKPFLAFAWKGQN